jgi:flagellar basal-body rod protein FlgG
MLSGLYSAASGMASQQAYLEAISNDLANVNTVGYRGLRVDFRELAYGEQQGIAIGSGSAAVTIGSSLAQGTLVPSQSPLSLAIQGPGYFQVRAADGTIALTRGGDFRLDAAGGLVLGSGHRLEPAITFPPGTDTSQIAVARDGRIAVGGTEVGRITIADVPASSGLLALGGGLYAPTQGSGAAIAAPASTTLEQGMLEASNVNITEAMVGMIEAQRGFQLASKAFRTQEQIMEIINTIRR